jgi:hypothetical protein
MYFYIKIHLKYLFHIKTTFKFLNVRAWLLEAIGFYPIRDKCKEYYNYLGHRYLPTDLLKK